MPDFEYLELRKKVAQLFIIRASGHVFDSQRDYPSWELPNHELKRLLEEGVGGVILLGGSCKELEYRCKMFKEWSSIPLLLCADVEEGLGQRFDGGQLFVPPMALGQIYSNDSEKAIELAELYGSSIGYQSRICGLNWVLAPVCDVNTNPANPVINVRAWGNDPYTVKNLVCAFQKGLISQGILSCLKHFPGHGDTVIDSHIDLPVLDHSLDRLDAIEFVPFRSAILEGASSVMTAHILLRQIDAHNPATLSKKITTSILRERLGFDGLVVTDALIMDAICQRYGSGEAAIKAFEAGADIILMPQFPDQAIHELTEAFLSKRLSISNLDKSLSRKEKAFMDMKYISNNHDLFMNLEDPKFNKLSADLIDNSVQIFSSAKISDHSKGVNLLRIDSLLTARELSKSSPAICVPENAGFETIIVHRNGLSPWQDIVEEPLALDRIGTGKIFLQLFIRGNPFLGSIAHNEPWFNAIKQLQLCNRLSGLVVYGSPYLWNTLTNFLDQSIPAAYSPGQMRSAQSKVLSKLFKIYEKNDINNFPVSKEFTL